jgi:hypothetical protein
MARGDRYILRSFSPSNFSNKKIVPNTSFRLSSVGVEWDKNLIKSSLAMGTTESNKDEYQNMTNTMSSDFYDTVYAKSQDITRINNDSIAFFDQDYKTRRAYLRDFSQNGEINSVIEMVADESIVPDSKNFFCQLDLNPLKSKIKKTKEGTKVIDGLNEAFNRIYQMYGWTDSNDAWSYMKKFLVDGYLAFEILFDYDHTNDGTVVKPKDIIGFKELDPTTLQPDIVKDEITGQDIKIWYQYKDDPEKERVIPDAHLIYISWQKAGFEGRVSYLEGLTRTFNMLRQLENSRIIWNIQNAQKRIKIVVPIGTSTPDRAKARLQELKAYYNEDVNIDDLSGEVTVNGQSKFSYNSTYIFPSSDQGSTDISELGVQGYDLNSIDQLKYWWRRFILETRIPANRFMLDPTSGPSNQMNSESNITREEYTFSRFIKRIQSIFKELIIKPVWIQFCLRFPMFMESDLFHSLISIKYNAENTFELAKERQIINDGAQTVNTLAGMKDSFGKPFFAIEFLVKKYLGISDQDLKQNEDYKLLEAKRALLQQIEQKDQAGGAPGLPGGSDMGAGGMDAGMGMDPGLGGDMSGGMDMGGDMTGGAGDMSGGMDMGGDMTGGAGDMSGGMM